MSTRDTLPDLLGRTSEVCGEEVVYRFENGLIIRTEVFNKDDKRRILPLGSPQGSLMNHMLNFPETVRGKRVFEPFAGSGALGFMALKIGARHVDFLDVIHRASDFHRENARLNQFPSSCFRSIEADIATFEPEHRYELILANPPFIPTPDGIEGTVTANGGTDGNRFVEITLKRLEEFLEPQGEALILLFQLVRGHQPLIAELTHIPALRSFVSERPLTYEVLLQASDHLHDAQANPDGEAPRSNLEAETVTYRLRLHTLGHVTPIWPLEFPFCFEFRVLNIRICFGFRASSFEFSQRMRHTEYYFD